LHPTIPFKCNTQSQKGNLGTISGKASAASSSSLQSSQAVGAEELLGLMKNYSRSGDSKGTITVGIVGFPNVGKSSLVNSLTRQRAVGVSPTPGFTRLSQVISL
jgi:nuclear GTP-binding protein